MAERKGIKEIAKLAGVSIGTVDRVLHNRGRVSEETKKRVKEIAARINYKPNIMAKTLVMNKIHKIAILIPEPSQDEYWQQAFEGIENTVTKSGQQGIQIKCYFYFLDDKKTFEESAKEILKNMPDGVIITPNFLDEGLIFYNQCMSASIPVIMFDTTIPDTKPLSFIGTDSFRSGMVAAELLNMISHENGIFAILHFDEELVNSPHMLEKERGFIHYLKNEFPGREYQVMVLNNEKHSYSNQIKELLDKNEISGIYVSTSKAYRIADYLVKEKLKPIHLVGYDLTVRNIEFLEKGYISFLINQNPRRQAEQSIQLFTEYFIFKRKVEPRVLFPIDIITKTSLQSNEEY
ncbi:MAG: substrate-binding domain-containing protein [Bacteroidales bacterium]